MNNSSKSDIELILVSKSYTVRTGLCSILFEDFNKIRTVGIIKKFDELKLLSEKSRNSILIIDMDYALEYHRYLDRLNERCKIIPMSFNRDDLNELEAFENHICIFDDKQDILDIVNRAADSIKPIESNKDSKGELTSREKEILQLVVKGLSSRAIADILGISVQTVSTHRKNISAKLEIKTVSGLTVYAALNNLINIDEAELI